jgi:hypothetical protein
MKPPSAAREISCFNAAQLATFVDAAQPASSQQIEQWSEASEGLVTTLNTKLAKRVGADEEKLSESVGEAIQWFLNRENTLETLRGTFPELHEALMGVIQRHGQRLTLYGPPADGAAHQILRSELEALIAALKEIPNVTDVSAQQLLHRQIPFRQYNVHPAYASLPSRG